MWGANDSGQLGTGEKVDQLFPARLDSLRYTESILYIERTDTKTDKQTDRQSIRQTNRQTDNQSDRLTADKYH